MNLRTLIRGFACTLCLALCLALATDLVEAREGTNEDLPVSIVVNEAGGDDFNGLKIERKFARLGNSYIQTSCHMEEAYAVAVGCLVHHEWREHAGECRTIFISGEGVRRLLSRASSSHLNDTALLAQLGITPETFQHQQEQMVQAAYKLEPTVLRAHDRSDFPLQLKKMVEYPEIARQALEECTGQQRAITRTHSLQVTLRWPHDEFSLSSSRPWPFLLPWTVRCRGQQWETYDIDLSNLVAPFTDPQLCARSFPLSPANWRDGFISRKAWDLRNPLNRLLSRAAAEGVEGYRDAAHSFTIHDAYTKTFESDVGLSVRLVLKPVRNGSIDEAIWYNQFLDNKLAATWSDYVTTFHQCQMAIAKRPWIIQWRKAQEHHTIDLICVGSNHCKASGAAMEAWKRSGIRGMPIEINLGHNFSGARCLISPEDDRTLILYNAVSYDSENWLDALRVTRSTLVLVKADGAYTRFMPFDQPYSSFSAGPPPSVKLRTDRITATTLSETLRGVYPDIKVEIVDAKEVLVTGQQRLWSDIEGFVETLDGYGDLDSGNPRVDLLPGCSSFFESRARIGEALKRRIPRGKLANPSSAGSSLGTSLGERRPSGTPQASRHAADQERCQGGGACTVSTAATFACGGPLWGRLLAIDLR